MRLDFSRIVKLGLAKILHMIQQVWLKTFWMSYTIASSSNVTSAKVKEKAAYKQFLEGE